MEIIALTSDLYATWDKFCLESDDAWFWHTTSFIEYTLNLRPELQSQSKSFLVINDNIIIAVCPLILNFLKEEQLTYNIFSFDRSYGYTPAIKNALSDRQKQDALKFAFNNMDEMAKKLDIKISLLKISPLIPGYFKNRQYNYLMKFGFFDTSLNTQLIDLTLDKNQLFKDITKGHKYDIHRGEELYNVIVYDKNNITKEIFEQYRLLHHKASGRITRPLITFEMMHSWILQGNAILCGCAYRQKYVSFALIIIYKDSAFYGSASDDPDIDIPAPVGHLIQWKVIRWLKEKGFRIYEIGLQQFGSQLYDSPSDKDKNISLFKRGFGGFTAPVFSGEKFYSKEIFSYIMQKRIQKFSECFPEG